MPPCAVLCFAMLCCASHRNGSAALWNLDTGLLEQSFEGQHINNTALRDQRLHHQRRGLRLSRPRCPTGSHGPWTGCPLPLLRSLVENEGTIGVFPAGLGDKDVVRKHVRRDGNQVARPRCHQSVLPPATATVAQPYAASTSSCSMASLSSRPPSVLTSKGHTVTRARGGVEGVAAAQVRIVACNGSVLGMSYF